jgi:hypothetical protein
MVSNDDQLIDLLLTELTNHEMNVEDTMLNSIQPTEKIQDDEKAESATQAHSPRLMKKVAKWTNKGNIALHFKCKYCVNSYVGPSSMYI